MLKSSYSLFLMMLLLIFGICPAQEKKEIGLRAGVNYSNYLYEDQGFYPERWKFGFTLGGYMAIPLSSGFSFQPEGLLTVKGYKKEYTWRSWYSKTNYKYQYQEHLVYLEAPMHCAFKISQFQIYAGPYIALFLGGVGITSEKNKSSNSDTRNFKTGDDLAMFDAGLSFGLEYISQSWRIGGRYVMGLLTLDPDGDYMVRNAVIQLNMGYSLSKLFFQ